MGGRETGPGLVLRSCKYVINTDGQNIQQSKLSVKMKLSGSGDLLTYYSLENFWVPWVHFKILFNVLMSLLDQSVASSLRRGGEKLELGKVLRSCKYVKLNTDIKLFVKCVLTAKRLTIRRG